MRLIDANVVMQRFIQESEYSGVNVVHINTIKRILKDIDTAYNMEKVVEELESLRIDKSNYFGVLNVVAEKYDRANEMLNDAIDIVRKGD